MEDVAVSGPFPDPHRRSEGRRSSNQSIGASNNSSGVCRATVHRSGGDNGPRCQRGGGAKQGNFVDGGGVIGGAPCPPAAGAATQRLTETCRTAAAAAASLVPQEKINEKLNNESIKVVSRGFHALKTIPPPCV